MKLDISVLDRDHFNAEEFFVSNKAKMEGIDNTIVDPVILANLNRTADKAEEIRCLLDKPVKISSGFRCLKLNRLLGSKDTSQHIKGQAIDCYSPSFGTPEEIVKFLKKNNVIVDQCLVEGSWLHLSIVEEGKNRNMFAYYLKGEDGKRKLVSL